MAINFVKMFDPEATQDSQSTYRQKMALAQNLLQGGGDGALYSKGAVAAKIAEKAFGGWLARSIQDEEKAAQDKAWEGVTNSPLIQQLIGGGATASGSGGALAPVGSGSGILNPPPNAIAPAFSGGEAGRTMSIPGEGGDLQPNSAAAPFSFSQNNMAMPVDMGGTPGAIPSAMAVTPTMDERNRDLAIRTIIGEAANQGDAGQAAVAAVLKNRSAASGRPIADEALAKNQFEPWNTEASRNKLLAIDPNSDQYKNVGQIYDSVLSGQMADPTGGATHFYAPKAQAALNRPKPAWDNGTGAAIGDHLFFKLPYGGGGAKPTQVASLDPSIGVPGGSPAPVDVPQASPVTPSPVDAAAPPMAPPTALVQVAQAGPSANPLAAALQPQIPQGVPPQIQETARQLMALGKDPRNRPFVVQQLGALQQQAQEAQRLQQQRAWEIQKLQIEQGNKDREYDLNKRRTDAEVNKPLSVAPNASLVDPVTKQPVYTAPAAPTNDITNYEYGQAHPGFTDEQIKMKRAGSQNTVINNAVNPVVKGIGDQFIEDRAGAKAAADTIRTLHEARALVDEGIYTGAGADKRLDLAKLGKAFNLSDTDKIATTEAFRSAIGQSVLNNAKTLGANPSEGDRKFIQDVMAGNITLDEKAIRKIVDIQEGLARGKIGRYNEQAKKLVETMPDLQQFGGVLGVDEPTSYDEFIKTRKPPAPEAAPANQDGWMTIDGVKIRRKQ